jgi:hypothetical protein
MTTLFVRTGRLVFDVTATLDSVGSAVATEGYSTIFVVDLNPMGHLTIVVFADKGALPVEHVGAAVEGPKAHCLSLVNSEKKRKL